MALILQLFQCFVDFWWPILEKDGRLDLAQIMRELYDHRTALREVGKAYVHLTNGKFSKPNTAAEYIIAAVEEQLFRYERVMADHPHCWHVTAFFVQTNPPQVLEVCCWCGDTRTQAIGFGNSVGEHGSFNPDQVSCWKIQCATARLSIA